MQEMKSQQDRKAIIVVAILSLAFLFAPAFPLLASHAAASITVSTSSSVSTNGAYVVKGVVSGATTTGTAVNIVITSPQNVVVDENQAAVGSNGSYSANFVAGGASSWTTGTYTVTATWGSGVGSAVTGTTTFTYTAATGSTTSGSGPGTTTTIFQTVTSATTTVVTSAVTTAVTTVVTQQTTLPGTTNITTVNQSGGGATTISAATTLSAVTTLVTTISAVTTISSGGSDNTGLYVGVLGVVIAIIAGAIAVMALRRK